MASQRDHGPCKHLRRLSGVKLFNSIPMPLAYVCIFEVFKCFQQRDINALHTHLNCFHPFLLYYSLYQKEPNRSLFSLDVLLKREKSRFITSVYRKATLPANR